MKSSKWEIWKMALGSFSDEQTAGHDDKIAMIRTVIVSINIICAFFIMAIDLINLGLTKNSPISKYFFDLCVDAPQYLSFGTFIDPILSNSLRKFIDNTLLYIYLN